MMFIRKTLSPAEVIAMSEGSILRWKIDAHSSGQVICVRAGQTFPKYRFEYSNGKWAALTAGDDLYCDPMEDLGALLTIMALDGYTVFY
jgi:hypothetical protein